MDRPTIMSSSAANLTAYQRAEWDHNNSRAMVGSIVTFLVLGNAACAFRIIAQYVNTRKALLEDLFMLTATACFDAVCACYLRAVHYGLGYHIWRIIDDDPDPPQRLRHILYWIWLPSVFNGPFFTAVKLCLLALYYRLFMVHQKWFKIAWWANLVYAILWFLGSTLWYILSCDPPSYYWNRAYAMEKVTPPHPIHGHCTVVTKAEDDLPLVFGLISDVGILALPICTLAKLHVPKKKKIGLMLLFSLGLCAIILEIARIVYLETKTGLHGYGNDKDITYDMNPFFILSCAVECIAIICASAPVIAPQAVKAYRLGLVPVTSSLRSRYSSKTKFVRTEVNANPSLTESDMTTTVQSASFSAPVSDSVSDTAETLADTSSPWHNAQHAAEMEDGEWPGMGIVTKRTESGASREPRSPQNF